MPVEREAFFHERGAQNDKMNRSLAK